MSSIGGVFSKKNQNIYPHLLDLIFSQKHRGGEAFQISTPHKTVYSKNIKELQKNFLKGTFGICSSLFDSAQKQTQSSSKKNQFSFCFDGQIYNQKELGPIQNNIKNPYLLMKKASGVYAIGLLEKNLIKAFRDPLGVKPVWFGENSEIFAFASEPLALKKLNIAFPTPLLPGHLIEFSKIGFKEKKVFDLKDFKKTVPKTSSIEKLHRALLHSVDLQTKGVKKCGVLFSGGVDSSVVAKLVSQKVKETILFTAGLKNSPDLVFSKQVAKSLGLKLVVCEIKKENLPVISLKVLRTLSFFDLMQLGIALPIFVCLKEAKRVGIRIVFSGQGSDEIFCGYTAYQKAFEKGAGKVKEGVWKNLFEMWQRNFFREDIISMHHSIDHRLPFLEQHFLQHAMALPLKEKITSPRDDLRKHAIRKIAKKIGLPPEVVERKKKAVQYGSGVQKELSKLF